MERYKEEGEEAENKYYKEKEKRKSRAKGKWRRWKAKWLHDVRVGTKAKERKVFTFL